MKESLLFTPCTIGPLTLRNRTIRAAAFEGMAAGNAPTDLLYNYHRQVAAGGNKYLLSKLRYFSAYKLLFSR